MNSILRSTLFIALLALGVASCKSDSDDGTGPGTTITGVQAKTGSTYTYDSTSSESNTTGSITYTIAADNLTAGTRTGVRMVKQAQDTAFMFAYNTDGSISMFFPMDMEGMLEGAWIKLPVKGGAGESLTVIDTTIVDPEFPLPFDIKITMQSSYVGTGSVTVSGKSYAGQNVKLVMTLESNLLGNTTSESTITWVPEIGFYGKMVGNTGAVGSTTTQTETLTSFTLLK
jgi:hypothetical protein